MKKDIQLRKSLKSHWALIGAILLVLGASAAWADGGLPEGGDETAADNGNKLDIYYENHTAVRGKDETGDTAGLSKFRNTVQIEADRKLSDGWDFHGIFRGTYDGVYDLNKG